MSRARVIGRLNGKPVRWCPKKRGLRHAGRVEFYLPPGWQQSNAPGSNWLDVDSDSWGISSWQNLDRSTVAARAVHALAVAAHLPGFAALPCAKAAQP